MELIKRGELPPNFVIQEFVHPDIIRLRGIDDAIQHVSTFQTNYANLLRIKTGNAIILNNWHTGGRYKNRGTRVCWDRPSGGGSLSMHLNAIALDCSSKVFTESQIFQCIMDNFFDFWEIGLTTFEDLNITIGWLHGDGRMYSADFLTKLEKEKRFNIVGKAAN